MKNLFYLCIISIFFTNCKDESDNIPDIAPVANFTYTVNSDNIKVVNFFNTSKSIHSQSKYLWYFGDGDSSFQENPVHTFKSEGYYNVVLRVTNKELKDSYSALVKVNSQIPDSNLVAPVISFVYTQNGRKITFQNTSIGPETFISYFWNFGDNIEFVPSGNSGNMTHSYIADGTYNVVFKAVYNNIVYCTSKSIYVAENYIPKSEDIVPVPSFSYFATANDTTIYFLNTSSNVNADTKYSWFFMPGYESSLENPDPVTFKKGKYVVVLKATNGNYSYSYTKEIEVPIIAKPVALFVYSQNGLVTKFVNASTNVSTSSKYTWYFGDGETSDEESPVKIYNAGDSGKKFNVILKVTNGQYSDVYQSLVTVQ